MSVSKLMKWLPKSFRRATRPATRAALALQTLEAREVPATVFNWNGNNGNVWNDPGNWNENAVPTAAVGDLQLVFPAGSFSIDNIPGLVADKITIGGGTTILLGQNISLGLDGSFPRRPDRRERGEQRDRRRGRAEPDWHRSLGGRDRRHPARLQHPLTGTGGQLWKTGTGTLKLTGAATYTGSTHIMEGVLALGNTTGTAPVGTGTLIVGDSDPTPAEVRLLARNQLPSATPVQIRSDGTLNMNHFEDVIGDVLLSGGALNMLDGNLAIAGLHAAATTTITADPGGHINLLSGQHTIEVDAGIVLTIKAPIRNAGASVGGITKTGEGELSFQYQSLNDTNTYTGLTLVSEGTLSLKNAGFDSAFGGDLQIGDGIGGLVDAIVRLDADRELRDGATVTLLLDGKLDLNGHEEGFANLVMSGGSQVTTGANVLTLSGDVTASNAGLLAAGLFGTVSLTSGQHNVTVNGVNSTLIIDGKITGAGGIAKAGDGELSLKGTVTNDYAGLTTVTGGLLELAHTAGFSAIPHNLLVVPAAGSAATVRHTANAQIDDAADVLVGGGGTLDLNGKSEFIKGLVLGGATGGAVTTGAGTLTLGGNVSTLAAPTTSTISGNLSLGNASRTFTIADGAVGADLQVDAIISAGGLVKNGGGRLLLTAPNTYTGDTTVNAGGLVVGVDSPNSDVFLNGGLFNPTADVGDVTGTGGTIAPGEEEPATAGAKNFDLGPATLDLTLYGPGALADQIHVTGTVDLTGG